VRYQQSTWPLGAISASAWHFIQLTKSWSTSYCIPHSCKPHTWTPGVVPNKLLIEPGMNCRRKNVIYVCTTVTTKVLCLWVNIYTMSKLSSRPIYLKIGTSSLPVFSLGCFSKILKKPKTVSRRAKKNRKLVKFEWVAPPTCSLSDAHCDKTVKVKKNLKIVETWPVFLSENLFVTA